MKKFLILMIGIIFLFSCLRKGKEENSLMPKKEIQAILDSFVQENRNKHYTIYELYINKLDPDNCEMILYAGSESLTQEENKYYNQQSLTSVVSQGVKINIYSGVERYFENSLSKETNHLQKNSKNSGTLLAIKDSLGSLHTYEIISTVYPFIPLPLENKKNTFPLPVLDE